MKYFFLQIHICYISDGFHSYPRETTANIIDDTSFSLDRHAPID